MNNKKLLAPLALLGSLFGAAAVSAPAQAAPMHVPPAVSFSRINYNPAGTDARSNSRRNNQLNEEYVRLTNNRSYGIQLNGWTIRERDHHVYTFQGNFVLNAHDSVVVHTGKGRNTAEQRYWGKTSYVWNNSGDTATLRNANRATVDTCTYRGNRTGVTNCK